MYLHQYKHSTPLYLIFACLVLPGCGESQTTEPGREGRMVYVDTVTAKPVVLEVASNFPAVHPQTGKRTLMPGLYCPDCQKWYPVPPPDQINRRPRGALCPKTDTPLTHDGPWPDEVSLTKTGASP